MGKAEKAFRSYGPEGGVNPHVAAKVKFNNYPSVFAIVDEYCLAPDCDCRDITLGFYEVVDNEFEEPHFIISVNVDTWEIKDQRIITQDLDCEAMIEEFIRDIDKPTKSRIRKRFETGKHKIEGKFGNLNNKEIEEIYVHFINNLCSSNEENDFNFKLLKDRYDRMKKINLAQHLTEDNGSDQSKQSSENTAAVKVGRNDPCPCGSGKKYKKCCGNNQGPGYEILLTVQPGQEQQRPPKRRQN